MVISSAASSTGLFAVQLAKLKGIKVVGLAGGSTKCEFVKSLGADYCLDYKKPGLAKRIREVVPGGVDFFFDNVGEEVLDSVL